ncbi:hypothetical protein [Alkalicoccus chagannorensis]|uniref:hypothetical protein n=1 Tax=Alkalicoccus chagannorensis TaxID=427072 RepID=UPI000423889E|nr:hypothetical protein [Alkalicoccus chagannorensis]
MLEWIWIPISVILGLQLYQLFLLKKKPVVQSEEPAESSASIELDDAAYQEEIRRVIELHCLRIRNAVDRQTEKIHYTEMKYAPQTLPGGDQRLLEELDEEEKALTEEFFRLYFTYLRNHWYSPKGRLKSVFSGNESDPDSEAGSLVQESSRLRDQMDAWFLTWRQYQ